MILFLIDADNLSTSAWVDEAFQVLGNAEGAISVRRAYGSAEKLKGLSETCRAHAIRPFVNLSLSKNTTDLALAVDAMEFACQKPRPTVVAIGSGDADFVPLVVRLREFGIRVLCVSQRGKMAQDAVPAYDQIIYVGEDESVLIAEPSEVPKGAAVKPPAPNKPKQALPLAEKSTTSKAASAAKKSTKKTAAKAKGTASRPATVDAILAAAPKLRTGEWQALAIVAKAVHDQNLIAKSATSTKLFKLHPGHFELQPLTQPNQVRYKA